MAVSQADFRKNVLEKLARLLASSVKPPELEGALDLFRQPKQTTAVLSRGEILKRDFQPFPRRIDPNDFPQIKGFEVAFNIEKGKCTLSALELSLGDNHVRAVAIENEIVACWDTTNILLAPGPSNASQQKERSQAKKAGEKVDP